MKFLIDTDVFSVAARNTNRALRDRIAHLPVTDIVLSVITLGEIEFGLAKHRPRPATVARIDTFRQALQVLAIDEAVARRYGRLRDALGRTGKPIGPNDLWIAAQALSADLTLVTGNEHEFRRVPELRVENWLQ